MMGGKYMKNMKKIGIMTFVWTMLFSFAGFARTVTLDEYDPRTMTLEERMKWVDENVTRQHWGEPGEEFIDNESWYEIDGYWFYYEDNKQVSGWRKIDGKWYYFLPENHRMAAAWQQVDGVWYYLNPKNGAMHEGWLLYGNDWYYLKPGSGAMVFSESFIVDGKTYYFDSSGVCMNP